MPRPLSAVVGPPLAARVGRGRCGGSGHRSTGCGSVSSRVAMNVGQAAREAPCPGFHGHQRSGCRVFVEPAQGGFGASVGRRRRPGRLRATAAGTGP